MSLSVSELIQFSSSREMRVKCRVTFLHQGFLYLRLLCIYGHQCFGDGERVWRNDDKSRLIHKVTVSPGQTDPVQLKERDGRRASEEKDSSSVGQWVSNKRLLFLLLVGVCLFVCL